MTRSKKHKLLPATALALPLATVWPMAAHAQLGFGISTNPDTQTHFVWHGAAAKKETGLVKILLVQNGPRKYEVNLSPAVNVHFAKSDAGKIKWCSYTVAAQESSKGVKKCTPDAALTPDGEITIP